MVRRHAFTLLELMIVIIIIGVLATLGVMQYQTVIERSRGAEAREIIGQLRSQCAAVYMRDGNTTNCTATSLGVGPTLDIPGEGEANCAGTHLFAYTVLVQAPSGVIFTADRCTTTTGSSGKDATSGAGGNLVLTTDYGTGSDVWTSDAGY